MAWRLVGALQWQVAGIQTQSRKLIRNVKDAEFIEMKNSDICCGFGGAFSVKYPEISAAILEDKVKNIIDIPH